MVNGKEVRVRRDDGAYEADGKHTTPYRLEWHCPYCGCLDDFDDYIRSPIINGPNHMNLRCNDCEKAILLTFRLELTPSFTVVETRSNQ